MKRSIKNTITILLIICVVGLTYYTMDYAKNHVVNQTPMQMDNNGTPPEIPSGNQPFTDDNANTDETNKPEQSQTDQNNPANQTEPPEKPDGEQGEQQGQTPPDLPSQTIENQGLTMAYYVVFGIESLFIAGLFVYLIMSGFYKKSFKETMKSKDKVLISVLSILLITGVLTISDVYITNHVFLSTNTNMNNQSENVSHNATGSTEIDGEEKTLRDAYTSSQSDESVILVKNGGNATINNATITKSKGDSTNTENSEFYGINAGVLVTEEATATIQNTEISTNAKGSNAVFSTGSDSKIYIKDSTIKTTGESSARGLDATYGGYIEADNVNITTKGGSCATLATDRGEGTVIAKNSTLETNGTGSPIIYSTGDISIEKTTGVANASQMVVIEGKNTATITHSTLKANGQGNRNDVDQAGVMIYQSMSGDASEGTGTLNVENSSLTIPTSSKYYQTAPMFFITNTDAVINLTSTELNYGSSILLSAKGTSEWGKEGSNGGNVTFNANSQTLKGDIELDKLSTLTMKLQSSTYLGTINADNTAQSISLTLDKSSKLTLTGDSYITSLTNEDTSNSNIDLNGYHLYVNGKALEKDS